MSEQINMSIPRLLTKSRFKLGLECPTKLFYTGKKDIYADQTLDDPFLRSLAEGGYQVGELAKHYFPGGVRIETRDYFDAADQTNELIEAGDCTIYEAAFISGDLFVYADIVERRGDAIYLYEVKAKSFDPASDEFLTKKRTGILAKWRPYLLDVAFQKLIISRAFPHFEIKAHLMMVDKTVVSATDGLNQKFRIQKIDGRTSVITRDLSAEDLSVRLLHIENVDEICEGIFNGSLYGEDGGLTFEGNVEALAAYYRDDRCAEPTPSSICRDCEFQTTHQDEVAGLKSGFKECWSSHFAWTDNDFSKPSVLDIWNFSGKEKDKLIAEGRVSITSITADDLKLKDDGKPGLSSSRRQQMQVNKARSNDTTHYLDIEALRNEMTQWEFPLHFIDFETSAPVIPFTKGRRPYEGLAFQYSHHLVHEDGTVEHRGEFLHTEIGVFPSYDFLRQLKAELEGDKGSIFRYAAHENTYLNMVHRQINADPTVADADELTSFIRSITKSTGNSEESWEGDRNMVDMLELVKRYYYDPFAGGSNSIKQILPAVLNSSAYLQEKYSKPIYGADGGIKSLNFTDWTWVVEDDGTIRDPYKLLPRMFEDISDKDFEFLMDETEIKEGGAAMTAYCKLQFEEMSEHERSEIRSALLKYCELDTLAMVMIYEAWREWIKSEPGVITLG